MPALIIIPYLLQTCAYLLLNFLFIAIFIGINIMSEVNSIVQTPDTGDLHFLLSIAFESRRLNHAATAAAGPAN